jgi:hypothetical protein
MARVAVQILLESGESAEPAKRRVELATDLIVRESTAPPGEAFAAIASGNEVKILVVGRQEHRGEEPKGRP